MYNIVLGLDIIKSLLNRPGVVHWLYSIDVGFKLLRSGHYQALLGHEDIDISQQDTIGQMTMLLLDQEGTDVNRQDHRSDSSLLGHFSRQLQGYKGPSRTR
jgi:hypothetical protein